MSRLLFLKKFLTPGLRIASVTPSSRALSEAVVGRIYWNRAKVIVELGAGTGPITEAILSHAPLSCRVIALERDPDFVEVLRKKFGNVSNLEIVQGSTHDLSAILSERGIATVDYIVSGLPVPSFPQAEQEMLFKDIGKVLSPLGGYSQITEVPYLYWSFYRRYFKKVEFKLVAWNIPPGGAYFCTGCKRMN